MEYYLAVTYYLNMRLSNKKQFITYIQNLIWLLWFYSEVQRQTLKLGWTFITLFEVYKNKQK